MARGVPLVFEHEGVRLTLREWAVRSGIPWPTLYSRVTILRWPLARALTERPARQYRGGGRVAAGVPRPCPRLKRHATGRAYARWKAGGKTHERYFGPWGSAEAAAAYRRFAGEWAAGKFERAAAEPVAAGLSVAELALAWLAHVRTYYLKDGKPTSYLSHATAAVRPLAHLDPLPRAAAFRPDDLRAVRGKWVAAKLSRSTCNLYTTRLVAMFRWGVGRSLVPADVLVALGTVEPLRAGRTTAPDRERRKPVSDEAIDATLPHLSPAVAAMVRVQRLAGMRPGEVCKLRPCDLDRTGEVWRYTVERPKGAHRGRGQVYYLGPRAIAALTPHLDGIGPGQRVFSLDVLAYGRAVRRAAMRAGLDHWTPHQLRHALATAVAAQFRSLAHAAAAIGDTEAVASAVYVHLDPKERAKIEVAKAMG